MKGQWVAKVFLTPALLQLDPTFDRSGMILPSKSFSRANDESGLTSKGKKR
jgi:hypothetical protein